MFAPPVSQIVNPRLKHTYVTLLDDGSLAIKSPRRLATQEVETLLASKSRWIAQALKRHRARHRNIYTLPKPRCFLWGEVYDIVWHHAEQEALTFCGDRFEWHGATFDPDQLQHRLYDFYRREARQKLLPALDRFARKMRVSPQAVAFRRTKRQWGSCSTAHRISLNTMLAKVQVDAAEYVVVHELAHIKHPHHQTPFWDEVAAVLPDYERRKAILKQYTTD